MPGLRSLVVFSVFAIALAAGTSVHAQYATSQVEHDWTITAFGGRFGYEQSVIIPFGLRTSKVYWGGGVTRINSRAGSEATLLAISLSVLFAGLVAWRIRAKRGAAAPSVISRETFDQSHAPKVRQIGPMSSVTADGRP